MLRNIELARELRVLGIADLDAVDPGVVGAVHAVESEDYPAPLPRIGNLELAAVGRDGIVVVSAGQAVEYLRPLVLVRVAHVRVAGRAVALHLDARGNVDLVPLRDVISFYPEIRGPAARVADPFELPFAVERHRIRRGGIDVVREGGALVRERQRIRAGGEAHFRIDGGILPVGGGCGRKSGKRRKTCESGFDEPCVKMFWYRHWIAPFLKWVGNIIHHFRAAIQLYFQLLAVPQFAIIMDTLDKG